MKKYDTENISSKLGKLYLKNRISNGGAMIKKIDGELVVDTYSIYTKLESKLNNN